ncbi:MAG: PPOX class F420-dependent oxidoreductase [Chloroflexi bacterium]|nr:PPOX class F420-dependent oxidoreductase [Chloroflexota bacterium]
MAARISADINAFLGQPHVAALATVRPDGRPHVAPVWFDFDGSEFTVSTFRGAQKLETVSHKAFAALSVLTQEPPYRNVIVEGTARIGSPPDSVWRERLAAYHLGDHAGRVYVQETADWDVIAIHIRPLRWTSTGFAES